jgi:hypothetical protein
MMIESIWYFIMAILYLTIGAYTMYVYMEPAWNKGFNDGWNSGMQNASNYEKWYMRGWSQGWDDRTEKIDYMEHFNRGFKAGWEASNNVTDNDIRRVIKEMGIK